MLTQCILWAGVIVECALLFRGARGKMFSRFPIFYLYILSVLVDTLLMYGILRWGTREQYALVYWICQFTALAIGSLVVFEIYRSALHAYPGTSKMARNALFFVFALAVAKALVYQSNGTLIWLKHTPTELERNLRIVQAFGILSIVCVLLLYAIPCNRNLKGILLGYGLFVGSSVFQLSLLSHFGQSFKAIWTYAQPFSYLLFLFIWLYALWSPAPEPIAPSSPTPEAYSQLASGTHEQLAKLRFVLRKADR